MEPIPVFDGADAIAATWSQTDESVTVTIPLLELSACMRPEINITQHRLMVRCVPVHEMCVAASLVQKEVTLIDHELSGFVSTDASAWTVSDRTVIVDLQKRPDYSTVREKTSAKKPHGLLSTDFSGEIEKLPWWPSAVRGGRLGPEDPNAPPKQEPLVQRLDCKIGEQSQKRKDFQGKSKFQW